MYWFTLGRTSPKAPLPLYITEFIRMVIDVVTHSGKKPGEVFTIPLENLPQKKIHSLSQHQSLTPNFLKELRDLCQVEVIVVIGQSEFMGVGIGLSGRLRGAVPRACELIMGMIFGE